MREAPGLSVQDPGFNSPYLLLKTNATTVKKYDIAYFIAYCLDNPQINQTKAFQMNVLKIENDELMQIIEES